MFVHCECFVLSGILCEELITCPEESYRLWCVVCDLETSRMRLPWLALDRSSLGKNCYIEYIIVYYSCIIILVCIIYIIYITCTR
jgi:hypothetical protein